MHKKENKNIHWELEAVSTEFFKRKQSDQTTRKVPGMLHIVLMLNRK